jgi:hypothetical protein
MNWHDFVRERVDEITGDAARDADIIEELAQHMSTRFDELVGNGMTEQRALDEVASELRDGVDLRRAILRALLASCGISATIFGTQSACSDTAVDSPL